MATVYLSGPELQRPNGLLATADNLYVLDMGSSIFYRVGSANELVKTAEGLAAGDGIVPVGKNDFLISNYNGEISYVTAAGQIKKLLDTKAEKQNAADIDYRAKENLVLVPTFFGNKVVAYELKK
ncbi:MAG: hypothetical protein M3142_01175 [Bacteroidota bacterium]|nr:hypothetical protein [Bacteroidota bacterium]